MARIVSTRSLPRKPPMNRDLLTRTLDLCEILRETPEHQDPKMRPRGDEAKRRACASVPEPCATPTMEGKQ